jgi:hypothetical protein
MKDATVYSPSLNAFLADDCTASVVSRAFLAAFLSAPNAPTPLPMITAGESPIIYFAHVEVLVKQVLVCLSPLSSNRELV